jgi:hypothetical protein
MSKRPKGKPGPARGFIDRKYAQLLGDTSTEGQLALAKFDGEVSHSMLEHELREANDRIVELERQLAAANGRADRAIAETERLRAELDALRTSIPEVHIMPLGRRGERGQLSLWPSSECVGQRPLARTPAFARRRRSAA